MSWDHAKDSILVGLLGIGVSILGYMALTIQDLNLKVAIILERSEIQGKSVADHETRLRELESKTKK